MAPSIFSLPPEVRIKVYSYVLRDGDVEFDFVYNYNTKEWLGRASDSSHSHTAILRTCRLIHQEALPVFYAENRFNCLIPLEVHNHETEERSREGLQSRIAALPCDKFTMIKNLKLVFGPRDDGLSMEEDVVVTPQPIVDVLHYLSCIGCSPKRLDINLHLLSDEYRFADPDSEAADLPLPTQHTNAMFSYVPWETAVCSYVPFMQDTSIARALAEVGVLKEVRIEVIDIPSCAGRYLRRFVHAVAAEQGWICQRLLYGNGIDHVELRYSRHWTWCLRPSERIHSKLTSDVQLLPGVGLVDSAVGQGLPT